MSLSIVALIQSMSSDPTLPVGSRVSLRNSDRTGIVTAVSGAGHVEIEFDDAPAGDTEVVSVDAVVLMPPARKLAALITRDDGKGSIRVQVGYWQNLCLNLIILDKSDLGPRNLPVLTVRPTLEQDADYEVAGAGEMVTIGEFREG